jgi:hypothetical protein
MQDADVPVEVVVVLSQASASEVLQAGGRRIGVSLRSLDPSGTDSVLSTYFTGLVACGDVDRVLEHLRQCEGVDAAYAKPNAEAP